MTQDSDDLLALVFSAPINLAPTQVKHDPSMVDNTSGTHPESHHSTTHHEENYHQDAYFNESHRSNSEACSEGQDQRSDVNYASSILSTATSISVRSSMSQQHMQECKTAKEEGITTMEPCTYVKSGNYSDCSDLTTRIMTSSEQSSEGARKPIIAREAAVTAPVRSPVHEAVTEQFKSLHNREVSPSLDTLLSKDNEEQVTFNRLGYYHDRTDSESHTNYDKYDRHEQNKDVHMQKGEYSVLFHGDANQTEEYRSSQKLSSRTEFYDPYEDHTEKHIEDYHEEREMVPNVVGPKVRDTMRPVLLIEEQKQTRNHRQKEPKHCNDSQPVDDKKSALGLTSSVGLNTCGIDSHENIHIVTEMHLSPSSTLVRQRQQRLIDFPFQSGAVRHLCQRIEMGHSNEQPSENKPLKKIDIFESLDDNSNHGYIEKAIPRVKQQQRHRCHERGPYDLPKSGVEAHQYKQKDEVDYHRESEQRQNLEYMNRRHEHDNHRSHDFSVDTTTYNNSHTHADFTHCKHRDHQVREPCQYELSDCGEENNKLSVSKLTNLFGGSVKSNRQDDYEDRKSHKRMSSIHRIEDMQRSDIVKHDFVGTRSHDVEVPLQAQQSQTSTVTARNSVGTTALAPTEIELLPRAAKTDEFNSIKVVGNVRMWKFVNIYGRKVIQPPPVSSKTPVVQTASEAKQISNIPNFMEESSEHSSEELPKMEVVRKAEQLHYREPTKQKSNNVEHPHSEHVERPNCHHEHHCCCCLHHVHHHHYPVEQRSLRQVSYLGENSSLFEKPKHTERTLQLDADKDAHLHELHHYNQNKMSADSEQSFVLATVAERRAAYERRSAELNSSIHNNRRKPMIDVFAS